MTGGNGLNVRGGRATGGGVIVDDHPGSLFVSPK